ncbi:MAG: FAD-dependent oxidoreductase [Terrisporobacter sp.]
MAVKEKVLQFANQVSGKKPGSRGYFGIDDARYKILEPVVSDEMAQVLLCMKIRTKITAKEVAPLCNKSVEKCSELLLQLAEIGVVFVNEIDGVDTFWYETWVPGIMEMMVNHKEQAKKYPQIPKAFHDYGVENGPRSTGSFPPGVGLMRVIPIETAIDGETRRASYEEISKYLNDNDIFTVSDCSCRTARESMGEGCGHLKEDMCIQMGHAAEYYIRTGRGRQISRKEAFEIIKRAEENGLMHQIPNLDGSGKTHAICNCCGCSCLALKGANMFANTDMVRSNYVSKVDKDKCVACGECVVNCPTNALKLGQKLCSSKPVVDKIERKETPRNTKWTEERWNEDYRTNREDVVESGTSPCKTACPAHIAVQGYIKLASQGKYKDALELIKKENPFPAICGRICPRKCESACTRGDLDSPLAIDEIKKFIAEQDLKEEHRFIPKKRHDYGKKIAVIGGGPAGLSCAYYLAIDGYKVTVFEKQEALGGMLTLGIPSFRLEKEVVNAEIDILRAMGIEFKTKVEVGKDITLEQLRKEGYKAFYVAIGAQAGRKLNIEGEDAKGVIPGVEFVRDVNLGKDIKLNGKVVVIGGGNVAIDVARNATRVGAQSVDMFCLENRQQMPALEEEVEEALEEDIVINNSYGPTRIVTENNKAVGVEFKKCISVFDENGRFSPKFDESDVKVVNADYVLISVGQSIDWGNLLQGSKVELNPNNTIKADNFTYQTKEADIFTGGDAYTGPRFAIDAIAAGKEGAISIHRFVQPGQSLVNGRDRKDYHEFDKESLKIEGYDNTPRQAAAHNCDVKGKETFKDIRLTFTEEQVKKETERCLGCGATVVDEYMCVGCGQCTTKCKFDAISLVRQYDAEGLPYEELKPAVVKTTIKRQGRIVAKKVKDVFVK